MLLVQMKVLQLARCLVPNPGRDTAAQSAASSVLPPHSHIAIRV
jgi:hypothetical protein